MEINFDIKDILAQMAGVVKDTAAKNWKQVKEVTNQFLQNRKERLQLLAELRIAGDLEDDKFVSRLEDEKLVFEAELNALAVITKALAQRAANAAIDIFEKAVRNAIGGIF